jgi:hypothetical protein
LIFKDARSKGFYILKKNLFDGCLAYILTLLIKIKYMAFKQNQFSQAADILGKLMQLGVEKQKADLITNWWIESFIPKHAHDRTFISEIQLKNINIPSNIIGAILKLTGEYCPAIFNDPYYLPKNMNTDLSENTKEMWDKFYNNPKNLA